MNHVNVTINGRQYRMACEEGQEAQLTDLADSLEARIGGLRGKFGEIGDARLTVMAALMVCDELLEAGQRIRTLEQELDELRDVRAVAAEGVSCPGSSADFAGVQYAARYEVLFSRVHWNPLRLDDQGVAALHDQHIFVVIVDMGRG